MTTATRERLHRLIDELPEERLEAVEAALLGEQDKPFLEIKTIPLDRVRRMKGIVSLGGNALEDTEALYDE